MSIAAVCELEVHVLPDRTGDHLDAGALRLEGLERLDRLRVRWRLDDVDFTGLEGIDDRLNFGDELEHDTIEIRELLPRLGVGLPVVFVAGQLMNSPLTHSSKMNGPPETHIVSFHSAAKSDPSTECFGMTSPKINS